MIRKYVIGVMALAVLTAGPPALGGDSHAPAQCAAQPSPPTVTKTAQEVTNLPEPPPGAIAFDMKYRGLTGEKDELRYNSYWGFGGAAQYTPFLMALRKDVRGLHPVYHPSFGKAQWSALEIEGNEAVAFYFDLNADGQVSDNEKIPAIQSERTQTLSRWQFVTPDFLLNDDNGRQVPFRAVLQASFYGESPIPNCMWSPSCVLEGRATLAGRPTKLILYASGFPGSFTQFGRCSYSLLAADEKPGPYVSRQPLSSLVNVDGQYYHLRLHGTHAKGRSVRAVFEKYTGDTGKVAVKLTGNAELTSKLTSARLAGTKEQTIRFNISGGQSVLPAEEYELSSGYIDYGTTESDHCRVSISEGPEFAIRSGETCDVELGKPVLAVRAIDEKQRYQSNSKGQSIFSKGTVIHLSPTIVGKAGERYGRWSRRADNSRSYKDVEPTISIVDSKGKEVASATMKYG